MVSQQSKFLLGDSRPKTNEGFKHTARGLEAIGFNAKASMYSVDHDYSPESDEERAGKKNKQTTSFLKKLVGGGKEKGEKV